MTATRCATKCGRPARGGVICGACTNALRGSLQRTPALIEELETTLSRQTASGRSEGGRSSEKPMAYGVDASNKLRDLLRALRGASHLLDPMGLEIGQRHDDADRARWLVANLDEIRQHDRAGNIHEKITKAVAAAEVSIDRRPDRWYAGACGFDGEGRDPDLGPCTFELYTEVGATHVRCDNCGEQWDVAARRSVLMDVAQDRLANASTLAAALNYAGRPIDPARIRQWAKRKKLVAVDVDVKGRPLYRVGDVTTLINQAESHNADISPEAVVESSSVCHTLGTGTSATPEVDEGSRS